MCPPWFFHSSSGRKRKEAKKYTKEKEKSYREMYRKEDDGMDGRRK
jgi:hypothetical protein